jgi:hypothetical protein
MDFTVFGLARSGTTAFSNSLNLHPQIFCANEFLGPEPGSNLDKSDFPEIFLDKRINLPKAEDNRRILDAKKTIIKYGNKYPRTYAYLDHWTDIFPEIVNLGIYRENLEFMSSWNLRATNGSWPPGRIGILGVIEQVSSWARIIDIRSKSNSFIFSYNRLFRDESRHFMRLISILELDCPPTIYDQFCRQYFSQKKIFEKPRTVDPFCDLSRSWFQLSKVDEIFYKNSGNPLSSLGADDVNFIRESVVCELPAFIEHIFPLLGTESREYLMTMRKFLSGTPGVGIEINSLLKSLGRPVKY